MARSHRLVIALDYGTAFTSVAYVTASLAASTPSLSDIEILDDYGPTMGNRIRVPSVYSYSQASSAGEQQWGSSISPNATIMKYTKRELDVQKDKFCELNTILQILNDSRNLTFDRTTEEDIDLRYYRRTPEEITTAYLCEIFKSFDRHTEYLGEYIKSQIVVDIVVTVPVNWSYRGINSIFRAVTEAGFNKKTFPSLKDVIWVSELEAAALYVARHLRDAGKTTPLEQGDCFVLCNAGAETVELISCEVKQVLPTLSINQIALHISGDCGLDTVNVCFKHWLKRRLGNPNYSKLEQEDISQATQTFGTETLNMRQIIEAFKVKSKTFSMSAGLRLDLPSPLDSLSSADAAVWEGELRITGKEMAQIFEPCVKEIVKLTHRQIKQADRASSRVKYVFLMGDFAKSSYLQSELKDLLISTKISLICPDMSQFGTEVVQGAVIYGTEKALHKGLKTASMCCHSYAIVLDTDPTLHKLDSKTRSADTLSDGGAERIRLAWLVRRGDLWPSIDMAGPEIEFTIRVREVEECRLDLPMYVYMDASDNVPNYYDYEIEQHGLVRTGGVECKLSEDLADDRPSDQIQSRYDLNSAVHMTCRTFFSGNSLKVEVHCGGRVIGQREITDLSS